METKVDAAIKELETKADKRRAELSETIKQAKIQSDKVADEGRANSQEAKVAATQIGLTKDLATTVLEQVRSAMLQTNHALERTHDGLKTEMTAFGTKQTEATAQARRLLAQLEDEDNKMERKRAELDNLVKKAEGEVAKAGGIRSTLELNSGPKECGPAITSTST